LNLISQISIQSKVNLAVIENDEAYLSVMENDTAITEWNCNKICIKGA